MQALTARQNANKRARSPPLLQQKLYALNNLMLIYHSMYAYWCVFIEHSILYTQSTCFIIVIMNEYTYIYILYIHMKYFIILIWCGTPTWWMVVSKRVSASYVYIYWIIIFNGSWNMGLRLNGAIKSINICNYRPWCGVCALSTLLSIAHYYTYALYIIIFKFESMPKVLFNINNSNHNGIRNDIHSGVAE